jgi:hypothetical protein
MAISANLERLGYDGPHGCIATGLHREVIQSVGATRTLLPEESGSLCLLDRAAGVVYTLPTPVEGMQFEFAATVSVTSNAYKIITAAATEFLVGGVEASTLTAGGQDFFVADGTTIRALSAAGSTTGGLIGENYTVTAISSTQWQIKGVTCGSGTLATPFAAS